MPVARVSGCLQVVARDVDTNPGAVDPCALRYIIAFRCAVATAANESREASASSAGTPEDAVSRHTAGGRTAALAVDSSGTSARGTGGESAASLRLSPVDFAWACHSRSQDALFETCVRPRLTCWARARELGVGYWLTNPTLLASLVETLSREVYRETHDPKEAALWYMALGRRAMLVALFRAAHDQKMVAFWGQDFSAERARAAALKNAYVLMGRRSYSFAMAFFLLGRRPREAAEVAAKSARDPQLALILCRLADAGYLASTDGPPAACPADADTLGPETRWLLETHVLPAALADGACIPFLYHTRLLPRSPFGRMLAGHSRV